MIPRKRPAKRLFTLGLGGVTKINKQLSASAIRAQRWREKRREQGDAAFREAERRRKESERCEKKRQGQIEDVLQSSDPPLAVVNEAGKVVRVTTGGYTLKKIERVAAASDASATGRRVAPKGAGFKKFKDSETDKDFPDQGREDTFVEKAFRQCRRPQDVRAMRAFVFQHVRDQSLRSKVQVCRVCNQPLTPYPQDVIQTAFRHIHDQHPELFKVLLARLGQKTVCPEDHRGLIERHSGNLPKITCPVMRLHRS